MERAIFLYPLGELSEYKDLTYIYNSEKRKLELPVLWLCERFGNVQKVVFIITKKTKDEYYTLFEKLCEFLIRENIDNLFDTGQVKNFKRREDFERDQRIFLEKLSEKTHYDYSFLVIDEKNLTLFIKDLKKLMQEHENHVFHIDITHGYRFIPMFVTISTSLLKNSGLSIKLGEILYSFGKPSTENRIISLKDYMDVVEWSQGIFTFKSSANIKPIAESLGSIAKDISQDMNRLQVSLDMNLAPEVKNSLKILNEKLENYSKGDAVFSIIILDEIKKMLSEFKIDGSQSEFELSLAKWHLKNNRYLHGYTALIEAFKSKLCEIYGYSPGEHKKCIYDIYNHQIKKRIANINEGKNITLFLEKLSKIRNTFAHLNELDASSVSDLYQKSVNFAIDFNPFHIIEEIQFSTIEEIFKFFETRITKEFTKEEVKQFLEEKYKRR